MKCCAYLVPEQQFDLVAMSCYRFYHRPRFVDSVILAMVVRQPASVTHILMENNQHDLSICPSTNPDRMYQ